MLKTEAYLATFTIEKLIRKPGIEEKGNSKSYKAAVVASGNKAADPFDMLRAGSAAATTMMEIHAS